MLVRPDGIPVVPYVPGLRIQAVHADDVADAYRRREGVPAVRAPAAGHAREGGERAGEQIGIERRLGGDVDRAAGLPVDDGLMDTSRARTELGWEPRYTSLAAVLELLGGIRDGASAPTPPLQPSRAR